MNQGKNRKLVIDLLEKDFVQLMFPSWVILTYQTLVEKK